MNHYLKKTLNLCLLSLTALSAAAQGTAFNYQGRLNDGGSPATGIYDITFSIFNASSGGAQQGNIVTNLATPVTNGLFTVTLDFGNQFPGAARWLELGVRTNNGTTFGILAPRQQILPTPYAIYSGNAASAATVVSVPAANIGSGMANISISGNAATATSATNAVTAVNFSGSLAGDVTGTQGATLASANFPRLNGTNVFTGTNRFNGVVIATNVNNQFVGLFTGNGGGLTNITTASTITNLNGTNLVGTIPDARLSTNVALRAGGNIFSGGQTFGSGLIQVFGSGLDGSSLQKFVLYADTGNGMLFEAPLDANNNKLPYKFSWRASSPAMVIATNGNVGIGTASPSSALQVNGSIHARTTTSTDGYVELRCGDGGSAGYINWFKPGPTSLGYMGWLAGGLNNLGLKLDNGASFNINGGNVGIGVGAATPNSFLDVRNGSVSAGGDCIAFGSGGYDMGRLGEDGGGYGNNVYLNNVRGTADGSLDFQLGGVSQMMIRGNGSGANVGIGKTNPSTALDVNGEITCVAINITSDRNAKEDFKSLNPQEVLDKVTQMPITEWQYKKEKDTDGGATRHIGPMAQDFSAAFDLGKDDKHISLVDEGGVALAAIQGLNQKLEDAQKENEQLKKSVEALQAQVQQLISASAKQ